MNDILKKRIEEGMADYADNLYPKYFPQHSIARAAFHAGAEYAISHQWISVEEALPNNHDYVLAGYKDSVFMAWCRRQYDEWYDIYGFELNVDRWMPIPKFETKEKEEDCR